ncbi:hypothetical protein VTN00DRAFT_6735 [Thermoascus crustaceus]|uniref:uncharacterized protein n=1 Tax=Thermoascus crustaceus TaxID=5088 RepID=UPI0037449593
MATEYSKKTNAELIEILKSRSLPHNGKKAELVARLQEDDAKQSKPAPAPADPTAKADAADDVIDWDDDEVKPSTEAGATAIAAGGKGDVPNPPAVPNQKLDIDPSKTDDLHVEAKGAPPAGAPEAETAGKADETAAATEEKPAEPAEKPAVDFSIGLKSTELEEELKKRKARAEKFGIVEDSKTALEEAEKALQRAKRFGTTTNNLGVGVKGLDEALPNERPRKRGRDNDEGGRGGKRRSFGGRNNGNRRRGPPGGGNGNRNRNGGGNGNGRPAFNEKDAAALEARKKRFGTS